MVALVVKEKETENSPQYILNPAVQPIEMSCHQDCKSSANEHSSAFKPVHSDHRTNLQQMLSAMQYPDDTTQVTWSSVHNYRCSVSATSNTRNYWKQPQYEDISNDSKTEDDDDEDEEIDVGSSYDTEISMQSTSDFGEKPSTSHIDIFTNSTAGNTLNTLLYPRKSPQALLSDIIPTKKEVSLTTMETEFAARHGDSTGDNSVFKKASFEKHCPISKNTKLEEDNSQMTCEISSKEHILNQTLSTSYEKKLHSPVSENTTDYENRAESFGLNWRNPENYECNSDLTSPISKTPPSVGGSSGSINSIREVILRRSSHFSPSDFIRYRRSIPSYPTENTDSIFISKDDILERRRSFGGGGSLIKQTPLYNRSYPIDRFGNLRNKHELLSQRRQTICSIDLYKKKPSSISSCGTDSAESLSKYSQEILHRRSSFGSTELRQISNLSFTSRNSSNTDEDDGDDNSSSVDDTTNKDISDGRESFDSSGTVDGKDIFLSIDGEASFSSRKEMIEVIKTTKSEDSNISSLETNDCHENISNLKNSVSGNEVTLTKMEQRKAVVVEAKNGLIEFSAEDYALRSRVLVLLWVLLGERRLREVGYPKEPVHRLLWRTVDVCCSVAGVKSAAAVPLNPDHDCGSDMFCFRDHTHRFLEVCAPTREHWKQFGWASLTVDAVVRKIYHEVGPPDERRYFSQSHWTTNQLHMVVSPNSEKDRFKGNSGQ